jgi:ABC-type nitrate/sulfonate/bicarbonate transport system permease component
LLGALLGEFLGGVNGLGVTMMGSMSQLETARTWGLALVATALGGIGYVGIGLAARSLGLSRAEPPTSVAPASSRTARSAPIRGLRAVGTITLSTAVTLGLWLAFVKGLHLKPFFAKTPADVWRFVSSGENRHVLLHALSQTATSALLGYVVGLAAASVGAVIFVLWRSVERAIMPFALVAQSIPLAALTPLLVLLLGRGLVATVVVSVLVTFFPSLVNLTKGMRAASPELLDLLRTYDASRWTTLRRVRVPTALPGLFAAARVSAPRALLGVLIAEYLATGVGVGWMLNLAKTRSEFALVWSGAVMITMLSVLAYSLVGWLERLMLARYAPEVMS